MEMEQRDNTYFVPTEVTSSQTFTFSKPNIVLSSPKTINFGGSPEHITDAFSGKTDTFTFAVPTTITRGDSQNEYSIESNTSDAQYKSKISRNVFKSPVSVFTQALKDITTFEQLKKNSKSQVTKINPENSIICLNVPQALLTKATAKEYFSAFGNVLNITIRPKKQIITATYATKEEADVGYYNSGEYSGEKFDVEWNKSYVAPKSPTKKKDLQKNIVSNFLKGVDNEVKSELDAMMNLEYNIHDSVRDIPETTSLKKNRAVVSKDASKSTLRMKKSTAKVEKHKPDNQISDLLPNTSIEEMQRIICQAAVTSEDKYKVLEARDRLMRVKQVKLHTLAAAKTMSGTCPDMCPEKERLMREAKRQVALYEQLEGDEYGINHAAAIKQYSRSSADQEEPMAHELRPVKSLKMTMSYLLHEIACLCDQEGVNLGEWYHFLWDRTRGIRKDITQQELCCTDSVELIEQCARFHILCSERLCAEDPSIFDKKINSDNLTKCLQSLKYMYHDLRVKGVMCKNESEFRAYIVLLNLNNGNFMWDLQKLPVSVQKSPEVQFALEVYSTLESNNYYKFFQLVRKTTYLNACILLRYFNQVRLKALSIMVKAYCRTASTAYPLYELIDILGFESENEAIYFCEQLGLNTSKDELHVLLNRQNFNMPVLNMKQNRVCNLVESKRTGLQISVGQCICGGKMPEKTYKHHKPHNSFDADGYLLPEATNAEDQNTQTTSNKIIDPYEFIDDDTTKIQGFVHTSGKNRSKEEIAAGIGQNNVFKPIVTSESSTKAFPMTKPEITFSFTSKPAAQNRTENRRHTGAVSKENIEMQLVSESLVFNANHQDVLGMNKCGEYPPFNSIFNTARLGPKTSSVFSRPFETAKTNDTSSPFSTAANTSILSQPVHGNIFAKNVTPTTSAVPLTGQSNMQTLSESSSTNFGNVRNVRMDVESKGMKSFPDQRETSEKQTSGNVAAEKLQLEKAECAKERERINESAEKILNDLQTEVIGTYCSSIVKNDIDRIQTFNALSEEIHDQVLNEVVDEICNDTLENEIVYKQRLEEMMIRMNNKVVSKYFNMWKQYTSEKKKRREALDTTPVWLQQQSIEQCAQSLYRKEQNLVIRNMCGRRSQEKVAESYINTLAPIEAIIYTGIKENLRSTESDTCPKLYWKLVISWPDLENKILLWHHKKIMNQYLRPDDYTTEPIVTLYRPNEIETLHICIRYFEGLISEHHLVGLDAVLFIIAASEDVKSVTRRLTKTVLSRHKLMPIPLAFIVLGDGDTGTENKEIISNLEALLESGYLSEYTIMSERDLTEKTILNLTQSAILWLSMNKSPPNPLEMDCLQDVYDTCLTEELWLRILGDSAFNPKLSHALKQPNFIISLHNEAVIHLIDIILDSETFLYTSFAPELRKFLKSTYAMPCSYEHFDDVLKEENYKSELEEVMSTFILPQWKYSWPIDNIDALQKNITQYCYEALSNSNNNLISFNILSNLFLTSGNLKLSNFLDLLLYIVKEKIQALGENFKVIYNKNHIRHFRTLPWWFKSSIVTEYKPPPEKFVREESAEENYDEEPSTKKQKFEEFQDDSFNGEQTLNELEPLAEFCKNARNKIMKIHDVTKQFEDRLRAHQQQNTMFEEELKNALLDDSI